MKTPDCNPHPLTERAPGCSSFGLRGRCAWKWKLFQDEPFTLFWGKSTATFLHLWWHYHVRHQLFC